MCISFYFDLLLTSDTALKLLEVSYGLRTKYLFNILSIKMCVFNTIFDTFWFMYITLKWNHIEVIIYQIQENQIDTFQ